MNVRGAAVQSGLAALGLVVAYGTWQREPERAPGEVVVVDASKVIYIDYTGTRAIRRLFREFIARGMTVAIARLSDRRSQTAVRRSGIVAAIGPDRVFKSVQDAVVALGPHAPAMPNA